MKLPEGMLIKPSEDGAILLDVVQNGTASLVMRLNGISEFLYLIYKIDCSPKMKKKREEEGTKLTYPCYVKVKNFLWANSPKETGFLEIIGYVEDEHYGQDSESMYPVNPVQIQNAIFIFMNDMSKPIASENSTIRTMNTK